MSAEPSSRPAGLSVAADFRFDRPPRPLAAERRLALRALAQWRLGNGGPVTGHEAHALLVADPAGAPRLLSVGSALAQAFQLAPGQVLRRGPGLADELLSACEIICLHPEPVPFEAIVAAPALGDVLVRGVALPLAVAADPVAQVQIIANWRQLLSRSAATRLRRELGAALQQARGGAPSGDPFAPMQQHKD
jgi:hypothetical protein